MKDEGDEDEDEGYAGNRGEEVRGVLEGCWYGNIPMQRLYPVLQLPRKRMT